MCQHTVRRMSHAKVSNDIVMQTSYHSKLDFTKHHHGGEGATISTYLSATKSD